MTKTERLDVLVFERGLVNTREAARTAIMDGAVLVNGQKVTKPGTKLKADSVIELIPSFAKPKYVSRGGLKLEKALREFAVDPADRICLDIGASTGGFTDCLLKHGARQVYAIDVGYGQLDYSLRTDRRVVVRERLNARYLTIDQIYGPPDDTGRLSGDDCMADLAVMDVSFISVAKIIPTVLKLLRPSAETKELICLVKPQFEAGKEAVGKGGVVKSLETHVEVLSNVCRSLQSQPNNLAIAALTYSPIKGPAGNIEFLLHARSDRGHATERAESQSPIAIAEIVKTAHAELSE